MATKLVFLVHGMGEYEDTATAKWVTSWTKALDDASLKYPFYAGNAFSKRVTLVPITYATIFKDYWEKTLRDVNGIKATLKASKQIDFAKIGKHFPDLDQVVGDPKKKTEGKFFWTHVCDVLLYFAGLDVLAWGLVAKNIETAYSKALKASAQPGGEPVEIHIICHSLGTRVVHDALRHLASDPKTKASKPGILGISSHHAVANVSRLMELKGTNDVYKPPMTAIGQGPIDSFYSQSSHYYHFVDPFTLLRRYDARFAISPQAVVTPTGALNQIELTRYQNGIGSLKDVHEFETYLKDPRVHIPIINSIFGGISDAEAFKAIADYDGDSTDIVNQLPSWARKVFPSSPDNDSADDDVTFARLVEITQ